MTNLALAGSDGDVLIAGPLHPQRQDLCKVHTLSLLVDKLKAAVYELDASESGGDENSTPPQAVGVVDAGHAKQSSEGDRDPQRTASNLRQSQLPAFPPSRIEPRFSSFGNTPLQHPLVRTELDPLALVFSTRFHAWLAKKIINRECQAAWSTFCLGATGEGKDAATADTDVPVEGNLSELAAVSDGSWLQQVVLREIRQEVEAEAWTVVDAQLEMDEELTWPFREGSFDVDVEEADRPTDEMSMDRTRETDQLFAPDVDEEHSPRGDEGPRRGRGVLSPGDEELSSSASLVGFGGRSPVGGGDMGPHLGGRRSCRRASNRGRPRRCGRNV